MAGSLCAACGQEGPSGFTVCDECEDGWVYPAPHGVDATDCPAFYDICRCEGTPCPSCRGSGLVPTDELREAVARSLHDTDPVYSPPTWEDCDESTHRVWYYAQADAVLRVVTEHLELPPVAALYGEEAPGE